MKPVQQSRRREARIANALIRIARKHGVNLRKPLTIDANGEFSIVASNNTPNDGPNDACGQFRTFAAVLSKYSPRTGIVPTSHLSPENGWCRMNHFNAERLVNEN